MVESDCVCYVDFFNRFMLTQPNKITFQPATEHGWLVRYDDQTCEFIMKMK